MENEGSTKSDPETGGMIAVTPLYPNNDVLKVIGEVCFLCFHSTTHRNWTMKSIRRIFEPPVFLKYFHIYRARNVPRGLVTWAKLDQTAEAKHMKGEGLDTFDEWQSGDQFWIIDLIAPWGHGKAIIKDIMDNIDINDIKTLRVTNGHRKVVRWHRQSADHKWKITSTRCEN